MAEYVDVSEYLNLHLLSIYSFVLNSAICKENCRNGGSCIGLDICKCQNGFNGTFCEKGIKNLVFHNFNIKIIKYIPRC